MTTSTTNVFGFIVRWDNLPTETAKRLADLLTKQGVIVDPVSDADRWVAVRFGVTQIGTAMRVGPPANAMTEILRDAANTFERLATEVDIVQTPKLNAYYNIGGDFGEMQVGHIMTRSKTANGSYAIEPFYRRGFQPQE